jgi:aryl-alcohol dehydrogenase-like predicted oxidoreductase
MAAVPSPRTITLGDYQVNRIGLGTNRLTDTPDNRDLLRRAVAAGVDLIDTAHLYTGGASERAVGAALSPFPDGLVVATKGGYHPGGGRPERLRAELEESFERLRTDSIALFYLHRVDPRVPLEETLSVLRDYRDAGRIRHVGLSEVSVEQIERARTVVPIAAVQNEYNLSERRYEGVLDFCEREDIAFVPFFPLRGVTRAPLAEIASRYEATPQQIMLAWLLKRSPSIAPIPGTLSFEHLRTNLAALSLELSDEDYATLNGARR